MSTTVKAPKNLLIGLISFIEIEYAVQSIVRAVEQAYARRDWDEVMRLAASLIDPQLSPACAGVGSMYAGLAVLKAGSGDIGIASQHFELATNLAPRPTQERVILSRSLIDFYTQKYDGRARACEQVSGSTDPFTAIEARRGLAVIHGIEGDHQRAIVELESLLPLVAKHKGSRIYSDLLNSYAVELAAVGRVDEARKASSLALTSPYASAYTEWQETLLDIESAAPQANVVALSSYLPLTEQRQRCVRALLNDPPAGLVRDMFRAGRRFGI
jgi:hypothetical protein